MNNLHLVRVAGVEFLHETREVIATKPNPCKQPDLPCPQCGAALTVRPSRIRVSIIVFHPARWTCELSERFWHYKGATDRQEAIRLFQEEIKI